MFLLYQFAICLLRCMCGLFNIYCKQSFVLHYMGSSLSHRQAADQLIPLSCVIRPTQHAQRMFQYIQGPMRAQVRLSWSTMTVKYNIILTNENSCLLRKQLLWFQSASVQQLLFLVLCVSQLPRTVAPQKCLCQELQSQMVKRLKI